MKLLLKHTAFAMILVPLVVIPAWMLMDRTPPYTFEHVEITPPPGQSEILRGGSIYITFTVKQNRTPCSPGLVYREFKEASGKLHTFDPVMRAETPVIVDNKFTRIAQLPEASMSPGPTIYRGTACYTCNLLHSWLRWPVCASTPPTEFNIVEKLSRRMPQ